MTPPEPLVFLVDVDNTLLEERELDDVACRYPAAHYVLVDDKPRILAAVKQAWGGRVTTVFPRRGHYARDDAAMASLPAPDVTVDRIGDLLEYDRDEMTR